MSQKRVVVIGGGIIGLLSALELLKRGSDVTVLERTDADHLGCSHGNSGIVVPSHFIPLAAPGMVGMGLRMLRSRKSPFGFHLGFNPSMVSWSYRFWRSATASHVQKCAPILCNLNLASRAIFEELVEDFGAGIGFEKRGLLMLCREQRTLDEEGHVADHANRLGLHARVVTGRELAEIDPDVTMDVAGAVHFREDCHASPHDFMLKLREKVDSLGGKVHYNTPVLSFSRSGDKITAAGEFSADEFVLATGSWSEGMAKQLGLRLPVQPGKGYSITVKNPVQLPELTSILTEARVAVTPMNGAVRFGGTMEIGAPEHGINQNRVKGILDSIPHYFPAFAAQRFEDEPVWSGLRPCSPDGMPYIGRTKAASNLVVATGHSMMGFSLGPITGRLVGEILFGDRPSIPIDLLAPDRFA